MNRETIYLAALMIVGLAILVESWPSVVSGSPSISLTLRFVGGLGLVASSGYYLLVDGEVAPENRWLYWIVVLGAGLALFGVLLQQFGV